MNSDSVSGWLRLLVRFGTDAPDLLSVLLGTLGAWCLGLIIEAYFIPETMPRRQQQGITILVTLAASVVLGDVIWSGIDPSDPRGVRLACSFVGGCAAPFLYPLVGRLAGKIPVVGEYIGSVWTLPGSKP